jgi:hypothetical protein
LCSTKVSKTGGGRRRTVIFSASELSVEASTERDIFDTVELLPGMDETGTLGDVCRLAKTVAAVDTASIYRLRCRRIIKEGSVSRSCNLSRIPPFSSDRLIEPEKFRRIAVKREYLLST